MAVQTTLMPSCFVFMNQTFGRHGVDHRDGGIVSGGGRFLVRGLNCLGNLLDVSTQFGTLAVIELAMIFGLTGPFFLPEVNWPRCSLFFLEKSGRREGA